ncbi:hypothetical protein LX87_05215 [Larkinella arboricola]|uniref:Uncharacterized protein n=1 Tax=Larkinella arboricola TaxID=643671 RepID=A0A327WNU8_LARAB|nr:hypothetical protein [Larkinella arboricola]RAJ92247.1 hypothetical protein LX87_05215 [Larkinella arboricola]
MWLFFSSVSASGEVSTHSHYCCEVEGHFDVLNRCVTAGYTLLSAFVIDQGQRTDLPLEAFDGQPVSAYIKDLQEQYQQVLSS